MKDIFIVFIVCIVCIFFIYNSNNKTNKKRGCLLLFGESFRYGNQGNRNRGTPQSYKEQIDAAKSHIDFINKINADMDVYLSSYTTKYDTDLINIYKPIGYDFYETLIGQEKLIKKAIHKMNTIYDYDFILIMRIDLFLKPKFTKIFNPNWEKIMWPSICFKPHHKCGIHPRVNDMMLYIPKKYYHYLQHMVVGHNLWEYLISKNLKYDDLDTMLRTFHDSDSAKDFNPLYYIVNRRQSHVHHTKDIFNKYSFE
jgi:hypothetical protein